MLKGVLWASKSLGSASLEERPSLVRHHEAWRYRSLLWNRPSRGSADDDTSQGHQCTSRGSLTTELCEGRW